MTRWSICLLLLAFATPARAADDPRRQQAEPIFQEGLKLHDAGKEVEALERFRRAYALYPQPNVLFSIARCEQLLGRQLDAITHYREAVRNELLHPGNRERAKAFIAELQQRLARVEIVGPPGMQITLDERTVTLPLPEPLDLEPGSKMLRANHAGVPYAGHATALAGQTTRLELAPAGTASKSPDTGPTPTPQPAETFWTTGHIVGFVGGALGVGAGVAGGVFTASANSASDRLADLRARSADPDNACLSASTPDCDARTEAASDRTRNTNLAVGSFVGAGVLMAGGAIAFFAWPSSGQANRGRAPVVAPMVGKNVQGVFLTKEF